MLDRETIERMYRESEEQMKIADYMLATIRRVETFNITASPYVMELIIREKNERELKDE